MVENNDLKSDNTMNSANVKLITDKKKFLEENTHTIQEEIKNSFEHLITVLKSREKQLLRQVEAIHVQQLSLIQSNLELVSCNPLLNVDLSSRYDIESQILRLGKIEVHGKNGISVKDTEPYKVQEYQDADKDHESFNKSIKFEEKDDSIELKVPSDLDVSKSDDKAQISDDSIFNCSCNSSFNSSVENENRFDHEYSVLSISNCTVIENKFCVENIHQRKVTSVDEFFLNNPSDLTNENLKTNSSSSVDLKESYMNNTECEEVSNLNFCKDINANKEEEEDSLNLANKDKQQIRRDSGEHPKQIQQWLQQILVETETEPMIHEIEQFSEISKARLSGQFPLET